MIEQGMHKNDANFVPLTPLTFLKKSQSVAHDEHCIQRNLRSFSWLFLTFLGHFLP